MEERLANGVTLRDPLDTDSARDEIHTNVAAAMERYVNGSEFGDVRLEVSDMDYADQERYSLAEQKEALMSDRTLARRLRGNVRLFDKETNELLDEKKNVTLARVPYLTSRGTMIHSGSEYAPISQSRLLPGAYTRRRSNGELETHFNTRPGTGVGMRVSFHPETAQYRLRMGTSDVHAYSVFRDLGVTDEELEARWGKSILDMNKNKYDKLASKRAYMKAVPPWEREDVEDNAGMLDALKGAIGKAQIAKNIAEQNLPNLYDNRRGARWGAVGAGLQKAASVQAEEAASMEFKPDTDAEATYDSLADLDFEAAVIMDKIASNDFKPDVDFEDIDDDYAATSSQRQPRLASMAAWPDHWLNDKHPFGWLQWYEGYCDGTRSDGDEEQIKRWKSFKARHGAAFKANPTPRRAYALRNWAIDPLKLLPKDDRKAFEKEMETYKNREYMKWKLGSNTLSAGNKKRLADKAVKQGATRYASIEKTLMEAATKSFINSTDLL